MQEEGTVEAPPMSYARAVDPSAGQTSSRIALATSELCPYFLMGLCRYGEECAYVHGETCELCGQSCLHPTDEDQRAQHNQVSATSLCNPRRLAWTYKLGHWNSLKGICDSDSLRECNCVCVMRNGGGKKKERKKTKSSSPHFIEKTDKPNLLKPHTYILFSCLPAITIFIGFSAVVIAFSRNASSTLLMFCVCVNNAKGN